MQLQEALRDEEGGTVDAGSQLPSYTHSYTLIHAHSPQLSIFQDALSHASIYTMLFNVHGSYRMIGILNMSVGTCTE